MRLSSYSTRHRHQILAGAATESAGPQMCARSSTERWDRGRPASRNTSQCTSTRALGSCSSQQNSVLSHLLEQFSSSQQTTDGRRQRRRPRHGLEKKSQKDGAGTECAQQATRAYTPGRCDTRCSGSRSEPRFPPFSSSLASLLFYSLRLLLCTVEAAALFSDQTIILLMPAVLRYVKIK